MKKIVKFLAYCLLIISFSFFAYGCTQENKNTEEEIDFYEIVSEIVGYQVTNQNMPYCIEIGTDNSYCFIDTNPYNISDYLSNVALGYITEMNSKLGFPEYVYQEMLRTSYLQGKQTETFGLVSVTWSYHPSEGLECTYKKIISK